MGDTPTSSCSSCGQPSRKIVINAFHLTDDARLEAPRCTNAMLIPLNYEGLVNLARRYAEQGPIHEIEIAAHGSGNPRLNGAGRIEFYDDPRIPQRWEMPGAAILGRRAEFVSGQSIETVPRHAQLSRMLGRCVQPGGIITWQCCNLGFAMEPHRDFITAFSALNPHLAAVLAANGLTRIGTPGLQNPDDPMFEGYRSATDGVASPPVEGPFPGVLPDTIYPPQRNLDQVVDDLVRT